MTNQNAHEIMYKARTIAAGLGVAGCLCYLWACGISFAGLVIAFGLEILIATGAGGAADLGFAGFLCFVWAYGLAAGALLIALALIVLALAIAVTGAIIASESKEQ